MKLPLKIGNNAGGEFLKYQIDNMCVMVFAALESLVLLFC